MHFPSDTKNSNKPPWKGVKTQRKIIFQQFLCLFLKKTSSNLTKNVKF